MIKLQIFQSLLSLLLDFSLATEAATCFRLGRLQFRLTFLVADFEATSSFEAVALTRLSSPRTEASEKSRFLR